MNPRQHPKIPYHGDFTPANLVFNDNLQEFSYQVSILCALETNGKLTPTEAYSKIKTLWDQLQSSKHHLFDD